MSIEINQIPHAILETLNARQAVLFSSAPLEDKVMVSTSLEPGDMHEAKGLEPLAACRRNESVYSITMTVLKVDRDLIEESTGHFENRYRIIAELHTLLEYQRDVYVVYVITHYNPAQKPYGPLTVNIGGDCHRTGSAIKDLQSILSRTRDLAEAMLKKAVMIFPDLPALHGGKKGEWIILDRRGRKIDGISEQAIIALGSSIIPKGIRFLNRYKEQQAIREGIYESFPERNYIKPDSGSPDVLSGVYWRGERKDKYINMCDAWHRRHVDLSQFTCLPANLGGTLDSSARPTGYGVATTTVELARRYFEPRGRDLTQLKFLLEAAGGVGRNTVESLVQRYGVPPENITVFDRQEAAARMVAEKFLVNAITLPQSDFYDVRLPEEVRNGKSYDVWVNNGEGDNTKPSYVQSLLNAGVRLFTGGANNYLEVKTEEKSRSRIFDSGGWAWPDPATSGGGWTLAVIGILTRSQGRKASTQKIRDLTLEIITSRNARLVGAVLDALPPEVSGAELWAKVNDVIEERVEKTLSVELTPEEILEGADTTQWKLT
ncbi:MAG: hypothetical protein K0U98_27660 [Deltaproteobacteria bacterium]|nr:hypothetical protein [Deltaproteobacteria bacterium]